MGEAMHVWWTRIYAKSLFFFQFCCEPKTALLFVKSFKNPNKLGIEESYLKTVESYEKSTVNTIFNGEKLIFL